MIGAICMMVFSGPPAMIASVPPRLEPNSVTGSSTAESSALS